ncbi:RNQ1-prion epigenetic modifier of function [Phialemonium atrogriseum]|uniref:RNQ1-prion epigenetic modifier of function n=1 Tax=Phialemonium atrogriseum TaxID=1093897 RepID=A0AAJ0CE51_9PEZI|nr:RNQ1-prion epigenetic modifier of function [Phialemonium atrogriseum]KAK1772656.1 RNQ1-prion epigenetic modifier of function [Phialemonium atrogriseum]
MAGPASPGNDGPTFAPPNLPAGWIAQWDGASKKYYYVQLSTGASQWDTPTKDAPVGQGSVSHAAEQPYGGPGQPQLITHPDGTQTVQHPDGTMEPVMPPGASGTRGGVDGPTGDRGLGVSA